MDIAGLRECTRTSERRRKQAGNHQQTHDVLHRSHPAKLTRAPAECSTPPQPLSALPRLDFRVAPFDFWAYHHRDPFCRLQGGQYGHQHYSHHHHPGAAPRRRWVVRPRTLVLNAASSGCIWRMVVSRNNVLYLIVGALVVAVAVMGYQLYEEHKKPGLNIDVGPGGLSIEKK
jgi:hypothetical protein